tara:strand:- start:291 stop:2888 length:2598 start_codon:yes stop_codon:yes gene_type:complete
MSRNDVSFSAIELKSPGSEQYVNILQQFQASSTFGGMSINEGLFETGISGFIILNDPDPSNTSSFLPSISNLVNTGTMLRFSFSTSVDTIDSSVNGLEFYVYNVSVVSDLSPGIATMGSSQKVSYRLEFTSYESSLINYETNDIVTLSGDYVASISDFIKEITSSEEGSGLMAPSDENAEIKNTAQIEPEIFSTHNGVWFKRNQSLYPWGKEKSIPSINTLIQSTLNYAIPTVGSSEDDPGVAQESNPSYVFYQSLPYGQWHYVPIGGGISDESRETASLYNKSYINGKENAGYHTYQFTMNETVGKRIELFKLIKDTDLLELEEAGVFGSRYRMIEPNYRGIYNGIEVDTTDEDNETDVHDRGIIGMPVNTYYHDAMSIATHLQQDDVVYEYTDFFIGEEDSGEEDIDSANPLLGKKIEGGRENPAFGRLFDSVYGYFDTSYLYKPFPTKNDDYASGRQNKYMWQTMFDMTEFPYKFNSTTGELGLEIIVQARNAVEKGKLAYAVLSDLKEQWNRYRHSVCCDNTVGGNKFLAMLVGATGGSPAEGEDYDRNLVPFGLSGGTTLDNLYRYSFVEVDVWPKVLVPQGITVGAYGLTGEDFDGVTFTDYDTFTYYDYISQKDINPATGEHEIYFAGNSGGEQGITLSFGLPNIAGSEGSGGQEYKINQEQELFVVPVSGGRRGLFTSYNTMELTNNIAFTGAGINKKGFNYPSGFGLMPIGGMTSGSNAGEGTTPIPKTYMGSVVEMSSIQSSDLLEINTNSTSAIIEYEPPDEIEKTGPNAVVGLLNLILGTENLPTTFGGSTAELSLINPDTQQVITLERDDKDVRPDISDNASPEPKKGVLEETNPIVYLFTAENDHDGKCST